MIRVVKLGGSLLNWPQFPLALRQWLSGQPQSCNILIAGGGTLADAIRRVDCDFALGEELSHWLCIDALSITVRILAAVTPDFLLVSSYADLKSKITIKHSGDIVFDPREFLAEHESGLPGRPLPHDWTVTSDSIAARIAECLHVDELVLLKSVDPPSGALLDLAAAGYVDRYLPTAAAKLPPPRFVNLRAVAF
jgi:5-(aminomethyl)-3-furanmethanol phosphate kinase